MKYVVVLDIEEKEFRFDGESPGALPDPVSLRARLNDVLSDQTKHDETIGWRVTNVSGVRQLLPDWMW